MSLCVYVCVSCLSVRVCTCVPCQCLCVCRLCVCVGDVTSLWWFGTICVCLSEEVGGLFVFKTSSHATGEDEIRQEELEK